MQDLNNVEKQLLFDLSDKELYEQDEYIFNYSNYVLSETDEIKQVQEIVYYIEKLADLNYLTIDGQFYVESDRMSFEYLNSAVEIDFNKIQITEEGKQWLAEKGLTKTEKFTNDFNRRADVFFGSRKYTLVGYGVVFILGLVVGKLFL